ncbi:MAG: outer membrane beta-barrel protein [Polyangiaceae bacterium]
MRLVVGGIALCGVLLAATPALANDPATANVIQIGAGVRYGIEMNDGDFNPWGVGLGLDGGYTLPMAVYVGGNFEYFFGDSVTLAGIETTGNVWQLTAEGGYDIGLGPIVLRPKLGAGIGTLRGESCFSGTCSSDSSSKFALTPGVKAMFFTPSFSLSVDTRYDLIFADETAKALIFTVGIGF